MTIQERLERARKKLARIRQQQEYQMQFAGVRLGVLARLRELERAQRRTESLIDSLEHWPSIHAAPLPPEPDAP